MVNSVIVFTLYGIAIDSSYTDFAGFSRLINDLNVDILRGFTNRVVQAEETPTSVLNTVLKLGC